MKKNNVFAYWARSLIGRPNWGPSRLLSANKKIARETLNDRDHLGYYSTISGVKERNRRNYGRGKIRETTEGF